MIKLYILITIVWVIIFVISFRKRQKKWGKGLLKTSFVIFLLLCVEFASIIGFKIFTGVWTFQKAYNYNAELFEPHPYLVGMPTKNAALNHEGVSYSHNTEGFRGAEFNRDKKKIIALGGSTTYCIGVSDWECWPYYLDSILSNKYNVLNFGVPGHSTVEHIIMSAMLIPEYKPDIVIVHTGLNDIRNMHVDNLKPDYSNFHAPTFYGSLGFCIDNDLPPVATLKLLILIGKKLNIYPTCYYHQANFTGELSNEVDPYVLSLYERNLYTLTKILESKGIEVVFVPQILSKEGIHDGNYRWWAPYVGDESFYDNLQEFNLVMKNVAYSDSSLYIDQAIKFNWEKEHFADPSHLNAEGNLLFAKIIAKNLKTIID